MPIDINGLVETMFTDMDQVESLLDTERGALRTSHGEAARNLMRSALQEQDLNRAGAAAMLASMIHERLGESRTALLNFLDVQQFLFMSACTEEQYVAIIEKLGRVLGQAEEIEAKDLQYRCALLAADCAFWAAQEAEGDAAKREHILTGLQLLGNGAGLGVHEKEANWTQKLVSLGAALAIEARSRPWFDEEAEQVARSSAALAAAMEQLVPEDFEYPGDPVKTNADLQSIADLSNQHGNPAKALAWLTARIRRSGGDA